MSAEFLTTAQTADVLRVHILTLARWRMNGTGPTYHKIGHLVRYSRADLDLYLSGTSRRCTANELDMSKAS